MADPEPVLLSVVIPTYNRAALLPRSIRSVLAETATSLEVIVVDDGSEDDTWNAVMSMDEDRLHYVRVEHAGVSAARNVGAVWAAGKWLSFLDSDDEVLPGWAEAMVKAAERSGGVALCGAEALDSCGRGLWSWSPPTPAQPLPQEFAERFLPGMFVVDRNAFIDAGGYVEELAFGENSELALRLLFERRLPVTVEPGILVRRHVSTPRELYSESRVSSARYVTAQLPWVRVQLPALWASYQAILGVDAARKRLWPSARRHFVAAASTHPRLEHIGRAAVAILPVARSRVWPPTPRDPLDTTLHVLLLVPEYPPEETGGIASYTRDLAHGLTGLGHAVHVLVVRRDQATMDLDDGAVRVHRRPQGRLVPGRGRAGWSARLENASFVQRLAHAGSCRRHVRELGITFDVVEACDWMAGGLFLPSKNGVGRVVHVHGAAGQVERRGRPSLAARMSEFLEKLAVRRSDVVTVPSPAAGELIRQQVGAGHKIRLVPCPTEVRAEVAPGGTAPPSVVYVGRMDWLKSPELLIEAGALLRAELPDVQILFVGRPHGKRDGIPYGQWLAEFAEEQKSPCRFIGPMERRDVLSFIASASVLAVTSRFEAFGLSAAEALAQGRPVVCTEGCGIAYLLQPPAGEVVPYGDPKALAEALRKFLAGGTYSSEARQAALDVARRHLSREFVAQETIACYREARET